jgi:hypothetical protein
MHAQVKRRLGLAALGTIAATTLAARPVPPMPKPAPQPRTLNAVEANARCESCHVAIADEWNRSMHHASHTDPVYQRAFSIEPMPFCQGCHAPEADARTPVPQALGSLGIGCVTCHLTADDVLAVPRADPKTATNIHPIIRDARFAGPDACASCHEFSFPDSGRRTTPELMQSTVQEHRHSSNHRQSCADCHMPLVTTKGETSAHRSHVFSASRDPAMVRRAVTIDALRPNATSIRLTLTPTWSGHSFPTGDLFRRIEVHADALGVDFQAVASETRYLMRHFAEKKHGLGVVRFVEKDDRPLDSKIVVDLDLGPKAARLPIAYRIAYQRVEHPRSERPEDSVVEGEIVLSQGTLKPLDKP